jgi:hypothetical protein
MDEYIQLLEDLCALNNRALFLGVNINVQLDAAARLVNAALDKNHARDIAEIKAAIRRPSSGSVN